MRAIKVFGASVLLVVGIVGGLLPALIGHDWLRPAVNSVLTNFVGAPVKIGGALSLQLLPSPEVSISGITLRDRRFGTDVDIKIDHVEAKARLGALVTGNIAFESLSIDSPDITLYSDEDLPGDGLTTATARVDSRTRPRHGARLSSIDIGQLKIQDAAIRHLGGDGAGADFTGLSVWNEPGNAVTIALGPTSGETMAATIASMVRGLFAVNHAQAEDKDGRSNEGHLLRLAQSRDDPAAIQPLINLPETPIDLAALFGTDANLKVRLDGIKASGFFVGPVALDVAIAESVAQINIVELGVYEGSLSGNAQLNGQHSDIQFTAALALSETNLAHLAAAANPDAMPIEGLLNAKIDLETTGQSPKDLVTNLQSEMALRIGALVVPDVPIGRDLVADVQVSGPNASIIGTSELSYDGTDARLSFEVPPISQILVSQEAPILLSLESAFAAFDLNGALNAANRSFDGSVDFLIPSVADAAAVGGVEYGEADPGSVHLRGNLQADPNGLVLQDMTIQGQRLDVLANSAVDLTGSVPSVSLALRAGLIDVDAYMPPPSLTQDPALAEHEQSAPEGNGSANPFTGLSNEPIDLSALHAFVVHADVAIDELVLNGQSVAPVRLNAVVEDGRARVDIARLSAGGGELTGAVDLAADNESMTANFVISLNDFALAGFVPDQADGIISGEIDLGTEGGSPREIFANLTGILNFQARSLAFPSDMVGEQIAFGLALRGPGEANELQVDAAINGRPAEMRLQFSPLSGLLDEPDFALNGDLDYEGFNANFKAAVPIDDPTSGVQAELGLDIESLAHIAGTFLPDMVFVSDPGPLTANAVIDATPDQVNLKALHIDSAAIVLNGEGQLSLTSDVPTISLSLKGDRINVDRLALAPPVTSSSEATIATETPEPSDITNPLASLPDEPLDLSVLSAVNAEVSVHLDTVTANGMNIGPIDATAQVSDGLGNLSIQQIGLLDATLTGELGIVSDPNGHKIELDAGVARLSLPAIGESFVPDQALAGVGTMSVRAKTGGLSVKELATRLSAQVEMALSEFAYGDLPVGPEMAFDLSIGGPANPIDIAADLIYQNEPVAIRGELPGIDALSEVNQLPMHLTVSSRPLRFGFDGALLTQPEPGIDGDISVDIGSVAELAAWLGSPLPEPDPGYLSIRASFAAIGQALKLHGANIDGEAMSLEAKGEADASGDKPVIDLEIKGGVIDLDRYLPTPAPESPPSSDEEPKDDRVEAAPSILDVPVDLSAIGAVLGQLSIQLDEVRGVGQVVGPIDVGLVMEPAETRLEIAQLGVLGGQLDGSVRAVLPPANHDPPMVYVNLAAEGVSLADSGLEGMTGQVGAQINLMSSGLVIGDFLSSLSGDAGLAGKAFSFQGLPVGEAWSLSLSANGRDNPLRLTADGGYQDQAMQVALEIASIVDILNEKSTALRFNLESAPVAGRFDGRVALTAIPAVDGSLSVDVRSVTDALALATIALDQPDPGPLAINADFSSDGRSTELTQASILGDAIDARMVGSADVSGPVPKIRAQIDVAALNLDAYLPEPKAKEGAGGEGEKGKPAGSGEPQSWSTAPIDFAALSSVDADILLNGAGILYRGLPVETLAARTTITGGRANIEISDMKVSSGAMTAALQVTETNDQAEITAKVSVLDVQANPVLAAVANMDWLSGRTRLDANVRTNGGSQAELVSALNGGGALAFYDGAIEGFNLAKTLRQVGTLGLGGDDGANKTDFSELSGTFTIVNGDLTNPDLSMQAPLVRLSGNGQVFLPPKTLDYDADAKLVASLEGQGGDDSLAGLPIPINVEGPWHDLSYGVQWDSVFAGIAEDPTRLANLPNNLRDAASGLGFDFPIPDLGLDGDDLSVGAAGAVLQEVLPDLSIGGDSEDGGILGVLPKLLPDIGGGGQEPASSAAPVPAPAPAPTAAEADTGSPLDGLLDALPIPSGNSNGQAPPAAPAPSGGSPLDDLLPGNLFN